VDVDGEITWDYDGESDSWSPDGEVTTHVVDEIMKGWDKEEKEPVTLFGEPVTQTTTRKGSSKDTIDVTEIMTAEPDGFSPDGIAFVYNGTGTHKIDATSTVSKETSGSKIASYGESETQWVNRTLNVEIPKDSDADYEWEVVSGTGESGGNRKWNFNFTPAKKTADYHSAVEVGFDLNFSIDGPSTLAESLNGFYSDSYKGEETYNLANETWHLDSGSGGGKGETNVTSKNSLDAKLNVLIEYPEPVYTWDSYSGEYYINSWIYHYATGKYDSSQDYKKNETFNTTFSVANNAWQREIWGKDVETTK